MTDVVSEMRNQIQALKSKVHSAAQLVEWLSEKISKMEYQAEEFEKPLAENEGYQALCNSMRDGFMASYHEEFHYRDMHDDKIFPNEFSKAS